MIHACPPFCVSAGLIEALSPSNADLLVQSDSKKPHAAPELAGAPERRSACAGMPV
jgi:hypothetical protein